ncbi:MAG: plastocyanin [Thermosynechococcaceae cyanobacterium]
MSIFKTLAHRIAPVLFSMCLALGVMVSALPAHASTVSIAMGEGGMLSFSPAEVSVTPGDTVHFDVGAAAPHNVVFDAANAAGDVSALSHNALEMSGGFDVSFPANAAKGEYPYYCEPHRGAGMVGKIVVQ